MIKRKRENRKKPSQFAGKGHEQAADALHQRELSSIQKKGGTQRTPACLVYPPLILGIDRERRF